jgi:Flp pilus assembly protein TadG
MKPLLRSTPTQQKGVILVLFSVVLGVVATLFVWTVDLGRTLSEQRKIQTVADAAALAGLNALGKSASYAGMTSAVVSVAAANQVSSDEITAVAPRCGVWLDNTFTSQAAALCDGTSTAVEVTIQRAIPKSFISLRGSPNVTLVARAVGFKPLKQAGNCIRPFGIEESSLNAQGVVEGGTFTVSGTQGSGNWGKIDLDGNSSSGAQYTALMLDNLCDDQIAAGNSVSVGTGNAQIRQVFDAILADATPPLASQGMVFAVTSDFPNGNGLVQLLRFIRVDLVSQHGSGQQWEATFRVVELTTEPDSRTSPRRQLME